MGVIENLQPLKAEGLECARGIAEYYLRNQFRFRDWEPGAGSFYFLYDPWGDPQVTTTEWSLAFTSMAMLAAADTFGDDRYRQCALKMGEYLKTLQIFSPYLPEHYGALREHTPQTTWCYVRDGLSGAWGFLELYRATGDREYLERATLWADWCLARAIDAEGWFLWGVDFEPAWRDGSALMRNDVAGDFSGGSLNFFYQLYLETRNKRWIGDFFTTFAANFVRFVQQPDGYYRTIIKATRAVPDADPQNGLHKSNDDLSSLGLLCAHRATGDPRYLAAVEKFLAAVARDQQPDGSFEKSVAGIPVVLNTILEAELLNVPHPFTAERERAALEYLFSRRHTSSIYPWFEGGINETGDGGVCSRSSSYALIVLLKLFAGEEVLLSAR